MLLKREFVSFVLHVVIIKISNKVQQSCDFESDTDSFCNWNSTGWTRTLYASESSLTGPSRAKQGDYYIYTKWNASFHQALLRIPVSSPQCLLFWYHMYGSNIANLTVVEGNQTLWIKAGDQNQDWHCGRVSIKDLIKEVAIEAQKGSDLHNIIALDHVQLISNIPCESLECNYDASTQHQQPSSHNIGEIDATTLRSSHVAITTVAFEKSTTWFSQNLPVIIGIPCGVLTACFVVVLIVLCRRRKNTEKSATMDNLQNQERIQRPLSGRYNADPIGVVNSTYDDINDQADYSVIPADYNVIPADYITPINVQNDEYTQHIKIETQHRNHYENGDFLSFEHQQRETQNSENIQREYKINQDDDGFVKANGIQQQN